MADVGIRIKAIDEASGVFGKVGSEASKLRTSIVSTEEGFRLFGSTASASLGKVEMSAAATAAAMRQVPGQFTDIITSLQGGQKPLTVLLQQGGQLKDMFGGIGNATKALGTYAIGLVNPFTAAAAAAGVLGYAFLQGQKESQEYQRVLLETGNAAGTTSAKLAASASSVAKSFNITQGAAAGALAALAATNNVATESFERFSGLAVKMNEITGRAVGETVKTLEELGKSPVEASVKYNEATHHLTASIYSQIKALQDQGKTAEAGALAQKAYFDAMNDRLPALESNLGSLERGWNALAKGAKGAWDAMLNIGRPTDPLVGANAALDAAQAAVERAKQRATTDGLRGAEKENAAQSVARLERSVQLRQQEVLLLGKGAAYEAQSAIYQKQKADEASGQIALDKVHDQYLRADLKMQQEIATLRERTKDAPQNAANTKKLNESIAGIREKYSGDGPQTALAAQIREYEDQQAEAIAIGDRTAKALAAQHAAQLLDDVTYYARKRDAALNANTDQQAVVELEKAAVASSGIRSSEKTAQLLRYNSDLKKLRDQALGIEDEYLNGLTAVAAKERKVQDDYITGLGKASAVETKRLADSVAAQTQHNAEIGKTKEQIADYKRAVEDAATAEKEAQANAIEGLLERNAALIEYGDTLGLIGSQAKDIYEEELKNLKEQIAQRKKLSALYADGAQKEAAAAASAAATAEWKRGWEETDRLGREVFTTWATDGTNAAQKIGDTLKKALLSAIYEATLKPLVFQLYTSVVGGGGAANTALQAASGGAGGASSLLGLFGNAGGLFGQGFKAGLGSVFGEAGTLGGLSAGTTAIGAGNIAGGLGTLAGTALPWIGGAMLLRSLTDYKVDSRGNGLTATVGGSSGLPSGSVGLYNEFQQTGGLGGGGTTINRDWSVADQGVATYITSTVQAVTASNKAYARAIGLTSDSIDSFTKNIEVNLTGLDAAGQKAAIDAALAQFSADQITAAYGTALAGVARDGETTAETLQRLGTELTTVNSSMAALGYTLYDVSVAGAAAASDLANAFGSLANFQAQTTALFQNYYTSAEQKANAVNSASSLLSAAGITGFTTADISGASREQIRAVVDQYAARVGTTEGDRQYAAVVSAANLLSNFVPAFESTTQKVADKVDQLGYSANVGSGGYSSAPVQDAALSAWQDATDAIVRVMGDLRTTLVDSGTDSFTKLQAQFAIELASAKAGNLSAAEDLPALVQNLAQASKDQFTTSVQRDVFVARLIESLGDVVNVGSAGGNLSNPNYVAGGPQVPTPVRTPPTYAYTAPSASSAPAVGADPSLLEEVKALRDELIAIRGSTSAIAISTGKSARILDASANGGQPLGTKVLT